MTNAELLNKLLRSGKKVCVAPMGEVGIYVCGALLNIGVKVDCFLDNNEGKQGCAYRGIKCLHPQDFMDEIADAVVIVASKYYRDITYQLEKMGARDVYALSRYKIDNISRISEEYLHDYKKNINKLIEFLGDDRSIATVHHIYNILCKYNYNKCGYDVIESDSEKQYFDEEILVLEENEDYVDVGAFDGDTVNAFIAQTNARYSSIRAYELDRNSYDGLVHKTKMIKNIKVVNKGVYSHTGKIKYCSDTICSDISQEGNVEGYVVRLDDDISHRVSLIKMDIEGSELEALKGAENIIRTYRPKLAIAIYHKPEDLYEIPFYIKSIVPEYSLYIRHYSPLEYETVLYAI